MVIPKVLSPVIFQAQGQNLMLVLETLREHLPKHFHE
jgi:hypothetical protein